MLCGHMCSQIRLPRKRFRTNETLKLSLFSTTKSDMACEIFFVLISPETAGTFETLYIN